MRYRLMATYQGVPYEAGVGPASGDVVLFAACPPPEELGFEPATGHWRKQLPIGEVQALWESRPTGTYRGERCMILDDLGDRLHIAYLGHDAYQAERLGFWEVDRGVFELVTAREDVSAITEERSDYPAEPLPPGQAPAEPGYQPASAGLYPPQPAGYQPDQLAGRPAGYPPGGPGDPAAGYGQRPAAPGWNGHGSQDGYGQPPVPPSGGPPGYQEQPRYPAPPGYGNPAAAPPVPAYPAGRPASHDPGYPAAPGGRGPGMPGPAGGQPAAPDPPGAVAVPPADETPLPLEAAALRASASRQLPGAPPQSPAALQPPAAPQVPAGLLQAPAPPLQPPTESGPQGIAGPAADAQWPPTRRRRAAAARQPTQRIFSELASQAAIPATAYSVGAVVNGAMCLLPTENGFEVFTAAAGAKHERRLFADEESAYFYLFGVLAAEAVRSGALTPRG